jgi:hypothetical protein
MWIRVLKRTVNILPTIGKQRPSTLSEGGTWLSYVLKWLQWSSISITSLIGWFIRLSIAERICDGCG